MTLWIGIAIWQAGMLGMAWFAIKSACNARDREWKQWAADNGCYAPWPGYGYKGK